MSVESATARQPPPGTATRNEQKWERIIRPKPQLHVPPTLIEFDPARPSSMFDGIRRHEHAFDGLRALERGKLTKAPNRKAKRVSGGVNGTLPVVRATDRHTNVSVRAVLKSVAAGGAQERFAYEFGAALGMDHLLPRVGRRSNGTAAIELVRGSTFRTSGIRNAQTLEKALRHSWGVQFPDMSSPEVRRRARIDRQLIQLYDYLLANGDRHGSNGMFDARSGRLTLIDQGLINRYDPAQANGLFPRVRMDFQGGDGVQLLKRSSKMRLEPEVLALVRGTDRTRVESAFQQMMRDVNGAKSVGSYGRKPTPAFLDQIMTRLDDVARTGIIRVH